MKTFLYSFILTFVVFSFFNSLIYSQPISYYIFTEMSGTSLIDHSGHNNNGQINGATWQQSSGLRGLSFNGSSNYVSVPHNSIFNFETNNFTIEVTFKTSVVPTGSWVALVSKHNTANWHDREFYVMIEGTTGYPFFGLSTENGDFERAIGTTNVCDGIFHTIRGVRQGNQLKLYLDGDLVATAAATIIPDNSNAINIGRSSYNNGYGYFNGIITAVCLWNTAIPVTPVETEHLNLPTQYVLYNNYPNPFNPSTKLSYSVIQSGLVILKVYDILGIEIETLVNEDKSVGTYELNWNASNLPSGIYFYRLEAGNFIETKKMVLLK